MANRVSSEMLTYKALIERGNKINPTDDNPTDDNPTDDNPTSDNTNYDNPTDDNPINNISNKESDLSDSESYLLFIKYLPKDQLLYELWKSAKNAQYMYHCQELAPVLTLEKVQRDINYMIQENRDLDLTTYYGRLIFADVTGDCLDAFTYDLYNGRGTAERIVNRLKKLELEKLILRYFTFY